MMELDVLDHAQSIWLIHQIVNLDDELDMLHQEITLRWLYYHLEVVVLEYNSCTLRSLYHLACCIQRQLHL